MPLPGTILFQHAMLPLHIFEPRYRAMLEQALEGDRMFCLALMKPGVDEARSDDDFHHVAGLGLIRACVAQDDGTSALVLQGVARVRLVGFVQRRPYRIAEIRELPCEASQPAEAADVARRAVAFFRGLKKLGIDLPKLTGRREEEMRDPALIADLVAHTLIRDPAQRQEIFETICLRDRLSLVEKYLTES